MGEDQVVIESKNWVIGTSKSLRNTFPQLARQEQNVEVG